PGPRVRPDLRQRRQQPGEPEDAGGPLEGAPDRRGLPAPDVRHGGCVSRAVAYHEGRFPPRDLDWPRLIPLLGPAAAAVARYDGMLAALPNPSVLLSPLTTQEAVLSSRIEGTQATIGEVLEFEAGEDG